MVSRMPIDKKALKQLPLTEQGELANLLKTAKVCQDVLQLYRIFERGLPRMDNSAYAAGTQLPPTLTIDSLSIAFVDMISEPRVSPEKILHYVSSLLPGMSNNIETVKVKIIILSVMRDAIKELSPNRVYRSLQHREDLYFAIIEALEQLEDELEDLEIQEMEKEEGQNVG